MSTTARSNKATARPLIALEASSASITTASVTIRTLRVNSRQLTMGTFRQLRQRPLVDEQKVELLGTVWGWVNYNPDGHSSETQFVVQFGEELCRSPTWVRDLLEVDMNLNYTHRYESPGRLRGIGSQYHITRACRLYEAVLRGEVELPKKEHDGYGYSYPSKLFLPAEGRDRFGEDDWCEVSNKDVHSWIIGCLDPDYRWNWGKPADEIHAESRANLASHIKSQGFPTGMPDSWWKDRIDDLDSQAGDYMDRWNALMDRLRTAEQLFIAT